MIGDRPQSSHVDDLRTALALLDRERPGFAPATIAVVARRKPGAIAELVAARFPSARVQLLADEPLDHWAQQRVPSSVRVDVGDLLEELPVRVLEHGTPELLIDARGGAASSSAKRIGVLLFAVSDGGAYLATGAGPLRGDPSSGFDVAHGGDRSFATALTRLSSRREDRADGEPERRNVAGVASESGAVLVTKAGRHHAKLDESQTAAVLTQRHGPGWGAELHVRPAETVRSKAKVTVNDAACEPWFPDRLHVPPMYVREHLGAVCVPRQIVVADPFIVPASFHHPSMPWPRNRWTRDITDQFVEIDADLEHAPRLPGTYFHLDSEIQAHFGHVFSEDAAKLWGWDLAQSRYPDIGVLRSTSEGEPEPPSFFLEALEAYGIERSRIVCISGPVRVERLVTASPLSHNRSVVYASELLIETWDRLREGLRSRSGRRAEKLFVTRPEGRRSCVNGDRLEAMFTEHGFELVQPELLPLAEQAECFASARVIAGYGGSAMLNMLHAEHPGPRIVIAADTYPARNEYLIAALKGDDFHYFTCPARPSHSPLAMHSDFEFDFERDGDALEQLLARV